MTTDIKIEDTVRLCADHTKTGVLVSRSPSGNFGAVEWETGGRTVVLMDTVEAVPLWSVTMANHLHNPRDPSDEPAFFHREFPGATREEAYAAAVHYGDDVGDCSPSGGVEDVEGPL
jgi:hypothetical protein